ncbi:hypothetical protein [Paenibacillus sp. URB8-2]|uniref:hypothetical protein n=1 Tax=Paenibacillus sp. URB8-2 TaxID=2741301 RepID=UPI0015BBFADE|nr:hypothetical protein [Paenibacillus sp. URB8-2]BCG57991.1 hypothetical protein PUR_14160 [Paenibacillus sp. URB8-2]
MSLPMNGRTISDCSITLTATGEAFQAAFPGDGIIMAASGNSIRRFTDKHDYSSANSAFLDRLPFRGKNTPSLFMHIFHNNLSTRNDISHYSERDEFKEVAV